MTLADLIRNYLEGRRKHCEQKARCLDWSKNYQYYSDHDASDDDTLSLSNINFFSNNLESKSGDSSANGKSPNPGTYTKMMGVSKTSRVITLPDGTVQTETVIRDSSGNTEKHVTRQKDGKKYTTITRINAAGIEEIEENVTDVNTNSVSEFGFPSMDQPKMNDDYNFWFNKFFQPSKTPSDLPNEIPNFIPNDNVEEQIERIIKSFNSSGMFDPFSDFRKTKSGLENGFSDSPFPNDTFGFFNEDRSSLEDFGTDGFPFKDGKKDFRKMPKQMKKTLEKMFPATPSMFDQFTEDALIELPDDEFPLNKFREPDEEKLSKLRPRKEKAREMIEKLDRYFENNENNNLNNKDVYSDIEDTNNLNVYTMIPRPPAPGVNDLNDIVRRAFDPRHLLGKNTQTKMFIDNGKKRIESIKTDDKGNTERNVSYSVGDKEYTIKIMIDTYGKEIKRETKLNFPKNELPEFKKKWSRAFQSDFNDE